MPTNHTIFIAGPTAVGKSAVALHLAQLLSGEIVSVDSMQVYRGLDIGTAKPTPRDRALIQHHLIDILEIDEPFDAAQFVWRARQAAEDVGRRGKVAIFSGGTGLYFKAFLEGVGKGPPSDMALRSELEVKPLPDLLAELQQRDPEGFAIIDHKNRRRVVRAVEVIRLTGRTFSEQRTAWTKETGRLANDFVSTGSPQRAFFGLRRTTEDLRNRIDRRVDEMFEQGLLSETERLVERGLGRNRTAMQALGYRQAVEHLRGDRTLAETEALVKQKTRQLAKRQMTWFRHQLPVRWIELDAESAPSAIAQKIAHALSL